MRNKKIQINTTVKDSSGKDSRMLWIFPLLLVLLYFLPRQETEEMSVHRAIVDSLAAGNSWGRQALTGSTDYPVFQSLVLLVVNAVAKYLYLDGIRLFCAVCQAWCLSCFTRMLWNSSRQLAFLLPMVLAFSVPFLRNGLMAADPGWAAAVPAVSAVYHLIQWRRSGGLRDAMLAGCSCGLLCLCGISGFLSGLFMLCCACFQMKKQLGDKPFAGIPFILWTPFVYCLVLWLLWNHLIMDDVFFGLRDLVSRLSSLDGRMLSWSTEAHRRQLALVLFYLAPLAILGLKSDYRLEAKCLFPAGIVLALLLVFSPALTIPFTGGFPLICCYFLSVYAMAAVAEFPKSASRTACIISCIICTFMAFRVVSPEQRPPVNSRALTLHRQLYQPPKAREITDYIDNFRPESRTMLYGIRLPALYPDTEEKRFLSRVDYQEEEFLKQAGAEQMHILVPPDNGKYYPPGGRHPLAEIHKNGKPWLLLEKQWTGGWQLWRAVTPPPNESKLDFLR